MKAVSDASGCVFNDSPEGIDIQQLLRVVHDTGSLINFKESQHLDREDIFDVKCDIFVPAALGGVINGAFRKLAGSSHCVCHLPAAAVTQRR